MKAYLASVHVVFPLVSAIAGAGWEDAVNSAAEVWVKSSSAVPPRKDLRGTQKVWDMPILAARFQGLIDSAATNPVQKTRLLAAAKKDPGA